jgi:hypothetical protein
MPPAETVCGLFSGGRTLSTLLAPTKQALLAGALGATATQGRVVVLLRCCKGLGEGRGEGGAFGPFARR